MHLDGKEGSTVAENGLSIGFVHQMHKVKREVVKAVAARACFLHFKVSS